jgi:predicted nucleotidyltransferase
MNIVLLEHMLNNKTRTFTIRQLAQETKTNYRIAHTEIQKLVQEKIVNIEKVGRASQCSLTYNFNEKVFLAEYSRRNKLPKKIKIITNKICDLKQTAIVLLFGSYAKGTQTKHSDIDILVIIENSKEIQNIIGLIPENIHLTTTTYKDFLKMDASKELSFVSEAVKNNVILQGIEEYYRLLKNAQ